MSTDQPIACSLTPNEFSRRLGEMGELGGAGLREVRRAGTRVELVFDADATARRRLEAIVADEAKCCPFLAMQLTDTAGAITLQVDAPEGAEIALATIVDAFAGRSPEGAR